ncbi:MAG: CHAT domain-containing protein [Bacteroidota bacterium]
MQRLKATLLIQKANNLCESSAEIDAARSLFQIADSVSNLIRYSFLTEDSRLTLSETTLPIYEHAIELSYQLYQCRQQKSDLENIFAFIEKSKALTLYESLQVSSARQNDLLPDSLEAAMEKLKWDLTFYRRQIWERPNASEELVKTWKEQLFSLEQADRKQQQYLRRNYPQTTNLSFVPPQLDELEDRLPDGTALMEYFMGENHLYRLMILGGQSSCVQIPLDGTLESSLRGLRNFLSGRLQAAEADLNHYQAFVADSRLLYETLLTGLTPSAVNELIIIPDGRLNYLPFDLLLTEEGGNLEQIDYYRLPYLLQTCAVVYQYSAKILLAEQKLTNPSLLRFGGFAPSYSGTGSLAIPGRDSASRMGLAPLVNTPQEVSNIQSIRGGRIFLGPDASRESFLHIADSLSVIHLAMHSLTYDDAPAYSSLVFTESEGESNLLYAMDIANLDLKAEMAVLSACNTGTGHIRRGEGVMSLARAFRKAGCPNIVMSLWQADDLATSKIMQSFYAYLDQGQSRQAALRQAKLDFLVQSTDRAHPHYWSAFVLFGEVELEESGLPWWWLLLGITLLGGGVMLLRSRTS